MKTIYVQIPAYRDRELGPTLEDLLAKADDAGSLRIAVFWQRSDEDELPRSVRAHPSVELIECPYQDSHGCNWARAALQKRWRGEPYTMLLDSHHRFAPGWDRRMVDTYDGLVRSGVRKPLLTAYLPPYDPSGAPEARSSVPLQIHGRSRERGMLIYLVAREIPLWRTLDAPIPARFTSLHFVFAAGTFNQELLLDDEVYFFGDEVVLALRAFTHGYDLYHPHYVIGWHLYDRTATRSTHWDDHADYLDRHERSAERLRDIFLGVDEAALGHARTLEEYERWIGDKLIRC